MSFQFTICLAMVLMCLMFILVCLVCRLDFEIHFVDLQTFGSFDPNKLRARKYNQTH